MLPLALLLLAGGAAASECEFLVKTDFQVPGGGELKVQKAATAQECCDACGAEPGCTAAAWNGNDENHLDRCYMKGVGALPKPSSSNTIGCQPKTALVGGSAGWGAELLLTVGLAVVAYVGGGVVLGGGDGGGLRKHPHHQWWGQVAMLVADGVATVRGGGRSSHHQQQPPGARPERGVPVPAGEGSPDGRAKKSKRHKEKRGKQKSGRQADAVAPLLPVLAPPPPPPPPAEASRANAAREPGTASGGGGRWVHVPT